jgi:hypothetical protein
MPGSFPVFCVVSSTTFAAHCLKFKNKNRKGSYFMNRIAESHSDVLALPAHYAPVSAQEAVYLDGGFGVSSVVLTGFAIYGAYSAYNNISAYLDNNPSVSESIQQAASSALRLFVTAFTAVAVVKLSYDIIVSTATSKSK